MFPVAYGNLHVFCYNVSPKHLFLQCFQCSGIQKPCKILLCTMFFFIFGRFSIAGKLPKWPKIPFQYPLALRHPKILEKCRKHHRILVSVRNRFWAPPPAKADIATAILTNVIEHLVLLFCPPISTPSPPKRCGRISKKSSQGKAQPARGSVHEPLELKPMMSSSEPKAKCCYRSLARLSLQVGRLELSEVLITQCGKAGGSVFCD